MKKILLIIFLFLCFTKANAQERSFAGSEMLEGISYMKNNWNEIQYRNAQVIRDTKTNEIAYCVEPFKLLVNNSSYNINGDYNPNYGINNDKWDKIKLYSYYGYGYKNHTDKKWISITQMSIWRTLFPNYQFDWINNKTDKQIIYPYNNELSELNNLVNNHYTLPNLKKEYVVGINDEIVLNDSSNILNNYQIISSEFDSYIEDNKLVIKTKEEEKEGIIKLQRASETFPESVKFFYSSESQNVMERGNIIPISTELKIKVLKGKIIVNKVDSETKSNIAQGEASLDGSIFELLNESKEVIKELTITNNTLDFDNLSFGKYYIREKTPGTGYYLNKNIYEVIIDENNLENIITIDNKVIKSKVKIIKFFGTEDDYEKGIMNKEEGISFKIYTKDNIEVFEGITNNNGEIEVYLPYGSYYLEQINTTEGYKKNEIYYFTINEDNSISYDIVLNDLKINVPNASISFFDYIINYFRKLIYV